MKRRKFLTLLSGGGLLPFIPKILLASPSSLIESIPIPTTAQELYEATNKLFKRATFIAKEDEDTYGSPYSLIQGFSSKSFEIERENNKVWIHDTYATKADINIYGINTPKILIRRGWLTMTKLYDAGAREILWRRTPTIVYNDDYSNKRWLNLSFRCSFDVYNIPPDDLIKIEGFPTRHITEIHLESSKYDYT